MEELGAADMAVRCSLSVHVLSQYRLSRGGTDEQQRRGWPDDRRGALGVRPGRSPMPARNAGCDRNGQSARVGRFPDRLPVDGHEDLDPRTRRKRTAISCSASLDPSAGPGAISAFPSSGGWLGSASGSRTEDGNPRLSRAELVFDDCEVPVANRLGAEGDGLSDRLSASPRADLHRRRCVGLARSALEQAAA